RSPPMCRRPSVHDLECRTLTPPGMTHSAGRCTHRSRAPYVLSRVRRVPFTCRRPAEPETAVVQPPPALWASPTAHCSPTVAAPAGARFCPAARWLCWSGISRGAAVLYPLWREPARGGACEPAATVLPPGAGPTKEETWLASSW